MDPSLHVTSQATGTCIRYGQGAPGHYLYYYRCFATGGGISDPCFAGPQGTAAPLVCPADPTTDNVIEFTATSITSNEPPSPSTRPWAMELSTGQVCLFVSAAWGGLGPYGCQPFSSQLSVADCHQPEQSGSSWAAGCQAKESADSPYTSIDVKAVWF